MQERPSTQYRIFRSLAVGDDHGGGIGAMTLAGTRIRGVIVDNPSGSWVQLDGVGLGFQPFIAPYTMAWSVSLLPSVTELSAAYVDGPTGQPSSLTGAPIVVYVFENQVPSSAGSSFAQQAELVCVQKGFALAVGANNLIVVLPPPGAGNSYRILSCFISLSYAAAGGQGAHCVLYRAPGALASDYFYTADLSSSVLNGPVFSVPAPGFTIGPNLGVSMNVAALVGETVSVTLAYMLDQ